MRRDASKELDKLVGGSRKWAPPNPEDQWFDCFDIRIFSDYGDFVYEGPKFTRCNARDCGALVTNGQVQVHGQCQDCGNRELITARKLTSQEKKDLLNRVYLLTWWEEEMIFGESNE